MLSQEGSSDVFREYPQMNWERTRGVLEGYLRIQSILSITPDYSCGAGQGESFRSRMQKSAKRSIGNDFTETGGYIESRFR